MRIGVDFDNTIVNYDDVFKRIAVEQSLIPPTVPARKLAVRSYLRAAGREEDWISLQGEVYGPGMAHARPFDGVLATFRLLRAADAEIFVISHRSRHPFRGPRHDLHAAANTWLRQVIQSGPTAPLLDGDKIFFELTREAKLSRIRACGCTHFIDDLPEFLDLPGFPAGTTRMLFDPAGIDGRTAASFGSWHDIGEFLLR